MFGSYEGKLNMSFTLIPTGKKQVFVRGAGKDEIVMETENRYKKHLQQEVPQKPEVWSQDFSQVDTFPESGVKADSLPEVGAKRWTNLPDPVDVCIPLSHLVYIYHTLHISFS